MSIVCFHHNDADGYVSAAIVDQYFREQISEPVNHIPIDYDSDIDPRAIVSKDDKVFVVDFSFKPDIMKDIDDICDLTWIDHHITAIKRYESFDKQYHIKKAHLTVGTAACVLTWKTLFPDREIPKSVQIVGDYDIWNHHHNDVVFFHYGIAEYLIPIDEMKKEKPMFWDSFINDMRYDEIVRSGKVIENYIVIKDKEICDKAAFRFEWKTYKCIAVNNPVGGSKVFDSITNISDYDIMIVFSLTSKQKWYISLYSNKEWVDVGYIASLYGGGGHKDASGMICDNLPFIRKGLWSKLKGKFI